MQLLQRPWPQQLFLGVGELLCKVAILLKLLSCYSLVFFSCQPFALNVASWINCRTKAEKAKVLIQQETLDGKDSRWD